MKFLVDTNVIGELARPRPDPGVLAWAEQASDLAISAVTVEEIQFGLGWKPNARIQAWLEVFLDAYCTVLPVDELVARNAGQLRGALQARGVTRTQADMLIAATASVHGLTLVTRNVRDFEGCAVALLDPFARG